MDYFKILNLNKEPFSNSPEPEFFFESFKHRSCLQQLELAIRLRRGLNIVIGDVGTGKTTLCRQLILRFSASEEDRETVETHLIMDPFFGSPLEFLKHVTDIFGISSESQNLSEWTLKESMKNYLFRKGVEESHIVVLIIDEGQKLPDFCLEVLREFLNYETNEAKLLQIVIFAQQEFQQALKERTNFADRINLRYLLEPLNFSEMRKMIAFRIEKASPAEAPPPKFFTYGGLGALYLATGGYPRRIITLCHQLMLSLIIKNRARIDWFMVRSCAKRAAIEKPSPFRWSKGALLGALAAVALLIFVLYSVSQEPAGSIGKAGMPSGKAVPIAAKEYPSQRTSALKAVAPEPTSQKPVSLGQIEVERGETVSYLLRNIYGNYNRSQMNAFLRANPHLLKNVNYLQVGEIISVPAVGQALSPLPGERCWVQVGSGKDLGTAYKLIKDRARYLPPVRLFPYWNMQEGLVFAICLKEGFGDEAAASQIVKQLPPDLAGQAKVIRHWSEGTEFYVSK